MKGYAFVYGVDGFGADTAPALEQGVYLDFNKAFNHFCELNRPLWQKNYYNADNFNNVRDVCQYLYENCDEPPLGMYLMIDVEIR